MIHLASCDMRHTHTHTVANANIDTPQIFIHFNRVWHVVELNRCQSIIHWKHCHFQTLNDLTQVVSHPIHSKKKTKNTFLLSYDASIYTAIIKIAVTSRHISIRFLCYFSFFFNIPTEPDCVSVAIKHFAVRH